MNGTIQNKLSNILAFIFLGFFVYILYKLAYGIIRIFTDIEWSSVNATVLAAVITATLGMTASVLAVVVGNSLLRKREIELQNRNKKTEAYNNFVRDLLEVLILDKTEEEKQGMYIKMAKDFGKDVILWGSDETIKAYSNFRELGKDSNSSGERALFLMEGILFSIRKDLGHKNKNLEEGVLLSLFLRERLNDLKEMYVRTK